MTTRTANTVARIVFPAEFNKTMDAPKSTNAKTSLGILRKRYFDFGAAKNPHKMIAESGNATIRRYLLTGFAGQ